MEEKKLTELIDEFLLNQINESDLAQLERLRNSDKRIDKHVKDNIDVFNVIQCIRYHELRQKLCLIDWILFKKQGTFFHDAPYLPFLRMAV
jgi:hypothetical protein